MAQAPYYHATLCVHGSLIVTKDEPRGGIKVAVDLGDTRVPIGAKKKLSSPTLKLKVYSIDQNQCS